MAESSGMKNVPLRDWNSKSYSNSGRQAKSTEPPQERQSAEGESWVNTDNIRQASGVPSGPGNTMTWHELDKNRCQGGGK
jgi:hypothetical protein